MDLSFCLDHTCVQIGHVQVDITSDTSTKLDVWFQQDFIIIQGSAYTEHLFNLVFVYTEMKFIQCSDYTDHLFILGYLVYSVFRLCRPPVYSGVHIYKNQVYSVFRLHITPFYSSQWIKGKLHGLNKLV